MAIGLFDGDIVKVKKKEQIGVFVLDGSGSMSDVGKANLTLAETVNRTFKDFISYFKTSRIADEFQIAVINFDNDARVRLPRMPLNDVNELEDFDPRDPSKDNPGTNIGEGLRRAKEIIDEYFSSPNPDKYPRSAVIVVLSDGMCQHPDQTRAIAKQVDKESDIIVSTALFSTDTRIGDSVTADAKNFLQEIKSDEGVYSTVYDEKALRNFFNASISVSKKKDS